MQVIRAKIAALSLALAGVLGAAPPVPPTVSDRLLTVCDVLNDLPGLAGKQITVLGAVGEERSSGILFCAECRRQLVTGAHQWPNSIYIHYAATAVADRIRALRADGKRPVIAVTGVLRVNLKRSWMPFKRRELRGGFGHLGVHPARLDATSIAVCSVDPGLVCAQGKRIAPERCTP